MIVTEICPGSSTVICSPVGTLDLRAAVSLRLLIAKLVQPDLDLVVDLRRVTFVDAVGISALLAAVRRVRTAGGTALAVGARPRVQRWLDLTRVSQFLIGPSLEPGPGAA
jgi:anti-anti-sigma factor